MKLGTLGGFASGSDIIVPAFFNAAAATTDGAVIAGHSSLRSTGTAIIVHPFRWTTTAGMEDLGILGGNISHATGMSSDGSVVVGISQVAQSNSFHSFRWTRTTGMVDLDREKDLFAQAVSSDGTIVAGFYGEFSKRRVFRWTAAGTVDLGTLGGIGSSFGSMNSDGSVIVGGSDVASNSSNSPGHAFRWTPSGGMFDLGTLGGRFSVATATNNDGSIVVGQSDAPDAIGLHAFRWANATGMVDLGTLGGNSITPTHVSVDGSVVSGTSHMPNGETHAFRWTRATGMMDLGSVSGFNGVTGMSADGSIIIGNISLGSGTRPYRWTSATGLQDLNTVMESKGVNMTDTRLVNATTISESGDFILGVAHFPGSIVCPYIVHFVE
jgi:probable HAF family extracellular repeat protein